MWFWEVLVGFLKSSGEFPGEFWGVLGSTHIHTHTHYSQNTYMVTVVLEVVLLVLELVLVVLNVVPVVLEVVLVVLGAVLMVPGVVLDLFLVESSGVFLKSSGGFPGEFPGELSGSSRELITNF